MSTLTQLMTLEAFLQLPKTQPASEFIHGEVIQKPMPQGEHSLIQTTFERKKPVTHFERDWIRTSGSSDIWLVVPRLIKRAFDRLG